MIVRRVNSMTINNVNSCNCCNFPQFEQPRTRHSRKLPISLAVVLESRLAYRFVSLGGAMDHPRGIDATCQHRLRQRTFTSNSYQQPSFQLVCKFNLLGFLESCSQVYFTGLLHWPKQQTHLRDDDPALREDPEFNFGSIKACGLFVCVLFAAPGAVQM